MVEKRHPTQKGRLEDSILFRPVGEITEAAQRHGWTVIALDENREGDPI